MTIPVTVTDLQGPVTDLNPAFDEPARVGHTTSVTVAAIAGKEHLDDYVIPGVADTKMALSSEGLSSAVEGEGVTVVGGLDSGGVTLYLEVAAEAVGTPRYLSLSTEGFTDAGIFAVSGSAGSTSGIGGSAVVVRPVAGGAGSTSGAVGSAVIEGAPVIYPVSGGAGSDSGAEGTVTVAFVVSGGAGSASGVLASAQKVLGIAASGAGSTTGASGTTSAVFKLATVTNLQATAGDAQVSLTWNAVSEAGATIRYSIQRSTSSNMANPVSIATNVSTASYTDSTAANGSTYYYQIRATASGYIDGEWSLASAGVTPATSSSPLTLKLSGEYGLVTGTPSYATIGGLFHGYGQPIARIYKKVGSNWSHISDAVTFGFASDTPTERSQTLALTAQSLSANDQIVLALGFNGATPPTRSDSSSSPVAGDIYLFPYTLASAFSWSSQNVTLTLWLDHGIEPDIEEPISHTYWGGSSYSSSAFTIQP